MVLMIVLAVVGIILIMAEVFLPGGILGAIGFICIGFSIYFASKEFGAMGLAISAIVLIVSAVSAWLIALKVLPRSPMGKDLFLTQTQKGYDTRRSGIEGLVGRSGVSLSSLRPTGKVEIDEDRYDAVTEGDFIENGTGVIVTGLRSNQLVVERVSDETPDDSAS